MIRFTNRLSLLALVVVLGFSSAAKAELTAYYIDGSGLGTGVFQYDLKLDPRTKIVNAATAASSTIQDNKASFFTIFDFAGYTGVSSMPANWTATT